MAEDIDAWKYVQSREILDQIRNNKPVEYDHIIVRGNLELSNEESKTNNNQRIIIRNPIRITNSVIEGCVAFNGIVFERCVHFYGTKFDKDVSFTSSEFKKDVSFSQSQFKDLVLFKFIKFQDELFREYGSQREGNKKIRLYFKKDYLRFEEARFEKDVVFLGVVFERRTNFRHAQFLKNLSFQENVIDKNEFHEDVDFSGAIFRKNIDFEVAKLYKKIILEGTRFKEFNVKWTNIKNHLDCGDDELIYLLFINNFKSKGIFEDADECYYEYRINRKIRSKIMGIFDVGARFLYGYGLKPHYPLAWSFCIILVSWLLLVLGNNEISATNALIISITAFTSGAKDIITIPANVDLVGIPAIIVALERLMGWIFFALFLAALGKTLIR